LLSLYYSSEKSKSVESRNILQWGYVKGEI
jgi:hypothetical protein